MVKMDFKKGTLILAPMPRVAPSPRSMTQIACLDLDIHLLQYFLMDSTKALPVVATSSMITTLPRFFKQWAFHLLLLARGPWAACG